MVFFHLLEKVKGQEFQISFYKEETGIKRQKDWVESIAQGLKSHTALKRSILTNS